MTTLAPFCHNREQSCVLSEDIPTSLTFESSGLLLGSTSLYSKHAMHFGSAASCLGPWHLAPPCGATRA